ncbi:MAG: extracellular solute-binding protein [Rhodospirillales bacterium]|nr:extracellular solute-binding protein [Rhodospirillales bacterium]
MRSKLKGTLWLAAGLVAAPLALTAVSSPAFAQAKELVIAAWGDPYKAVWYKSIVPNFEKATGAKIVWSDGFSSATLSKLTAQKDKPEIDLAMFDDGPYFQAVQLGLCRKLDFSKLPNAKDMIPAARDAGETGILWGAAGTGIFYHEPTFKEKKWAPPASFQDLWRPELKGQISIHNIKNSNGLFLLLSLTEMSGGKIPDNMEPGWAKLKDLAPRVATFDQYGETPTLVQQGVTVIGVWSNDRAWNLAAVGGVPIKFVFAKEGLFAFREAACIPNGRPDDRFALAHTFINMMMSKEQQEINAKEAGFIPFHTGVTGIVTAEETARIKFPNWDAINKNRAAWTERWNKEIERK